MSSRRMLKYLGLMILAMGVMVGGCRSGQEEKRQTSYPWHKVDEPVQDTQPAERPVQRTAAPTLERRDGWVTRVVALPTGRRDSSVLLLERQAPAEVAVGQAFDYIIKVTNISSDLMLEDVTVTDTGAEGFEVDSAEPSPEGTGRPWVWNLGSLAPGESKTIRISGAAARVGTLADCVSVTYDPRACLEVNVVEPAIALAKTAPREVMICDPIPVQITVTNNGNGVASNVVIEDQLPEGLTTADGQNSISARIGDLRPGESRTVNASLKAARSGEFTNVARASADGNLTAESETVTVVRQPVLAIEKTGPQRTFIRQEFTYNIRVTNTGDGEARETVVTDTLPENVRFVGASAGGQASGGRVTWNLGTLRPEETREMTVTLMGEGRASVRNIASASAHCAATVTSAVQTAIEGIPAVLLEMIDVVDPVRVGTETTYVITITNQGSADAKEVTIIGTFEPEMEYRSSTGATTGRLEGDRIVFAPLPVLPPQAKATWSVVVRAINPGDVRFHVELNEAQLTRPVIKTESTNFYE